MAQDVTQTSGADAGVLVREGNYGTQVIAVEPGGAEFIPLNERHGRPIQLFWTWTSPNMEFATIFVGVRLGLIFTLINVVGVEFLINFGGLGQLINDLAERYDLAGTYAAICFVILVSIVFFMALEKAERWLRPVE